MNIVILGAGAMGCLYGAAFHRASRALHRTFGGRSRQGCGRGHQAKDPGSPCHGA